MASFLVKIIFIKKSGTAFLNAIVGSQTLIFSKNLGPESFKVGLTEYPEW
jgi:hypothetical protein